jgi:hypothetical protein
MQKEKVTGKFEAIYQHVWILRKTTKKLVTTPVL